MCRCGEGLLDQALDACVQAGPLSLTLVLVRAACPGPSFPTVSWEGSLGAPLAWPCSAFSVFGAVGSGWAGSLTAPCLLGPHLVVTNCSAEHSHPALSCKMAAEFDAFLASGLRWVLLGLWGRGAFEGCVKAVTDLRPVGEPAVSHPAGRLQTRCGLGPVFSLCPGPHLLSGPALLRSLQHRPLA